MPAWDQHDIPIRDRHRLIQLTIVGIDPLNTETARRVKPMLIGLFQLGDAGKIVFVMAMAWIA